MGKLPYEENHKAVLLLFTKYALLCFLPIGGTTPNKPNHQTLNPFGLIQPNIWGSFLTFASKT